MEKAPVASEKRRQWSGELSNVDRVGRNKSQNITEAMVTLEESDDDRMQKEADEELVAY
jgi:hypothetical protein